MGKELKDIAQELKDANKKVQLIYAFNGSGKTRLSREFKELIAPKNDGDGDGEGETRKKILYYNAFTEDLFYWDNDLEGDGEPKLKIQPNSFTDWILRERGDTDIVKNFQRYANDKLTPLFHEEDVVKEGKKTGEKTYPEVTFSLDTGTERSGNFKISKGEESNFIWSIFFTLLDQVVSILNIPESDDRDTKQFDQLEYVFIDDPVSSLDENHLIQLAVDIAELIKSAPSSLKFVVTTHNPLFYNVLHSELNKKSCYLLERFEDGSFSIEEKDGASNKSFSYHLYLKQIIEQAIAENNVQKYHFMLLRNLYEKTAHFLEYEKWSDLLDTAPGDKDGYLYRIIQFSSHKSLSNEEVAEPTEPEKRTVKVLLDNLVDNYGYWRKKEEQHG